MYLSQKLSKNIKRIYVDLMGGSISIKTYSGDEVIVDARKMRYAGLIPYIEIESDIARIYKQAPTAFFPQKEKIIFKILLPEKMMLDFKMFAGELTISGSYDSLNIKIRTGNVVIEGPYFSIDNDSRINVINGNIEHRKLEEAGFMFKLKSEMESTAILNSAKLYSKVFLGGIP